ncbi:hypothetical protein Prum_011200 [Phytohabitans rumicis]|uniref:Uncharacterized protein n=1 Tax=Phytohabitans rumicis TaxID=1076125 RepID=A0A6V8KXR1_9ACTN|nr:hypothetical protein Prum_011200 [Phytohabitans rumicis]
MPVLRELLAGTLDVTASRRLNMSPRTFNRRVAELLRYLGQAPDSRVECRPWREAWRPYRTDVRRAISRDGARLVAGPALRNGRRRAAGAERGIA